MVSAILGLVVGALPLPYTTVGRVTLGQQTDEDFWNLSADDALREDVHQLGVTIQSLRAGNERIAKRVMASLVCQLAAAVLLTVSVSIDLLGRTTLFIGLSDYASDWASFGRWPVFGLD